MTVDNSLPSRAACTTGMPSPCPSSRRTSTTGVDDLILGVLPGNDAAIRLYERHGYRRTWTYPSRFAGR